MPKVCYSNAQSVIYTDYINFIEGFSVESHHPVVAPHFNIQLSPMEIRTFNVTVANL